MKTTLPALKITRVHLVALVCLGIFFSACGRSTNSLAAGFAGITRPVPGSVLTDSPANFEWSPGSNVSAYWLYAGRSKGTKEYYNSGETRTAKITVSNLPQDGSTVYVRLWYKINSRWQYTDYSYATKKTETAASNPEITSPVPGSTLADSLVNFEWSPGSNVSAYWLYAGRSKGTKEYYNSGETRTAKITVSNLPRDGSTVHVRFWYKVNSRWQYTDYSYATRKTETTASNPEITRPAPDSVLADSLVNFEWSPGSNVSAYWLYAGRSKGTKEYYNSGETRATKTTVSGLPRDGRKIYTRLWRKIGSKWLYKDYVYTTKSLKSFALASSEESPFGMLTSFYPPERTEETVRPTEYKWKASENDSPAFSTALDLGTGWERGSHPVLDWSFVQKSAQDIINKNYDWSVSDNYIKQIPAGLNLIITLNVGDSRLKAGTWEFSHPQLKTEYADFVKAAVERYNGDGADDMPGLKSPVKYWQFENEPVSHIDRDSAKPKLNYDWKGFSELLKVAYESVKSADVSAKVLSAGTVDAGAQRQDVFDNFWFPLIQNLNGKYLDIFDMHWFSDWEDSRDFYNQIRSALDQNGFSDTPIWMTENGSSSKAGEALQAKDLIRRMVYPLSYGVEKVFWAWGLVEGFPPFDCNSMFDYTGLIYDGACSPDEGYGVKKLGYYTYKKLIEILSNSDFDGVQKIQESGGVYVYKFPRQGKDVWVIWNENSGSQQITISGITSSLIKIIEAVPNYSLGKEVKAYNGAFKTEIKSVSGGSAVITAGDTPVFVEEN